MPGTEDAMMLKTWPSWTLDGRVEGRTETHNKWKAQTGQADKCHEGKHSRVRALWMLYWERDTQLRTWQSICLWKGW